VTARRLMPQSGRNFGAIERQYPHGNADSGGDYSGNARQFRRCNRVQVQETAGPAVVVVSVEGMEVQPW